ncbi:MAG: YdaU family protein [Kiritimatiellaeota bacterium]|nr:YdaU family protein [Kiritimatiellota bacterium]
MKQLHTMPLNCEKFLSSRHVRRMRWDERGAYLILLTEAWLEGARLPKDYEEIRRLLGIDDDAAWRRIKRFVLDRMFESSEDGLWLYNRTQVQVYEDVRQRAERLSNRQAAAARARWSKTRGESGTDVSGAEQQERAEGLEGSGGDASAMPRHSHGNAYKKRKEKKDLPPSPRGGNESAEEGGGKNGPSAEGLEVAARLTAVLGRHREMVYTPREIEVWARACDGLRRRGVSAAKQMEMIEWLDQHFGDDFMPGISSPAHWRQKWGALLDARDRDPGMRKKRSKRDIDRALVAQRRAEATRRAEAERNEKRMAEVAAAVAERRAEFEAWLDAEGTSIERMMWEQHKVVTAATWPAAERFLSASGDRGRAAAGTTVSAV